jgi:rod shape determining protein RodA
MMHTFRRYIRSIDWFILAPMIFLMSISLLLIYGLSINPIAPDPAMFRKQLVYVAFAIACFVMVSNLNYRIWQAYGKVLYLIGALMLIGVLIVGVSIRGHTGWFSLGFISIQPVEFAKVALIVFLAKYFSDHGKVFFLWRYTIMSGLAMGLYVALVLKQPDLGSAMVLIGCWFLLLFAARIPGRHIAILFSTFVIVALVAWVAVLKPYQKDRIMVFINPQIDTKGIGYNVHQSIIAIGSGRLFGRGFGSGSQSQLKFLPEPETDFIFAVLGEDFGLLGILVTVGGLLAISWRLLVIGRRTDDNFAAYFCMGLVSMLTVQSFINMGMNMGIAPVTGIPLPFISAGGSSLIAFSIALGIASSIVADNRTLRRVE